MLENTFYFENRIILEEYDGKSAQWLIRLLTFVTVIIIEYSLKADISEFAQIIIREFSTKYHLGNVELTPKNRDSGQNDTMTTKTTPIRTCDYIHTT